MHPTSNTHIRRTSMTAASCLARLSLSGSDHRWATSIVKEESVTSMAYR